MNIKSVFKRFIFGEEAERPQESRGYIHIITPEGDVDYKGTFDGNGIDRALNIITKEKVLNANK